MDLRQAMFKRRSTREYTEQSVAADTIRQLIDVAIQAPSAVNQQPWTFTVVRDQKVLDDLSREAKAHMHATMPNGPHAERLRAHLSDPQFHIFYHAPTLIVISAEAQGPWIVEDCALAAENLMLAAVEAGLGSCWIGFAQSFLNSPEGKRILGMTADWVPVSPIIVGYPRAAPEAVPRRAPEVRWIG